MQEKVHYFIIIGVLSRTMDCEKVENVKRRAEVIIRRAAQDQAIHCLAFTFADASAVSFSAIGASSLSM